MAVRGALGELSSSKTKRSRPVGRAPAERVALPSALFTREPLSPQLERMLKLALDASPARVRLDGDRAALTTMIARQADSYRPAASGEHINAVPAFMARPSKLIFRACVVMLCSTMAACATFATASAVPDDALHDVKLATEQLRLSLAHSPAHRVAVELDIADSRLREAVILEGQGRNVTAEVALSGYAEHLATAAATLQEMQPAPSATLVEQMRAQLVRQQQTVAAARPADMAPLSQTALASVSEVAASVRQADQVAPDRVANSAAAVAVKAAASVERRAESTQLSLAEPRSDPTPSTPGATPSTTAATSTQASASRSAPASATATARTDRQSESSRKADDEKKAEAAKKEAAKEAAQKAEAAKKAEAKKAETAARIAKEAAERAKEAAERAKQAAQRSARESGQRSQSNRRDR